MTINNQNLQSASLKNQQSVGYQTLHNVMPAAEKLAILLNPKRPPTCTDQALLMDNLVSKVASKQENDKSKKTIKATSLTSMDIGTDQDNNRINIVGISSLSYELGQLNGLLEEQNFAEYWASGMETLCTTLCARAVSLCLIETHVELTNNVVRRGDFTPSTFARIESWEANLRERPNSPISSTGNEQIELNIGRLSTESSLFHIRISVEHIVRGAVSIAFDADRIPPEEMYPAIYHAVQMFGGNALRAQYLRTTRERLEKINLLYQITQAVTGSLDLNTVLNQTTELAAYVLEAQAATLFRLDVENEQLVFMITTGSAASVLEEKRIPIDQGVVGWVAMEGKPLIVNDTSQSPLFDSVVDSQTGFVTQNIICVPLRVQERTVGVLEVLNKENPEGFGKEDVEWLTMMGQQVAIALDNAYLFSREQEKVRELAMLNQVSQTINSELDVSVVLNSLTQQVLEILSADRSELLLVNPKEQTLELFASAGHAAGVERQVRHIPLGEGLDGWSAAHNEVVAVRRLDEDVRYVPREGHRELDQGSAAVVPLTHRGRVIGVIMVYSLSGRPFDREQRELLYTFANQAAIALQNAQLYQDLRAEQERIIRAQEEVRHQLARDLHDNTAQMLSLIIMNLDLTRQMLTPDRLDRLHSELDSIEQLARQANREIRTLLFELRPIILESRGLVPALHAYHRQLATSIDSKIHLDTAPLDFQIELQGASTIFSIIQEAVNNIRKYAKAKNIWIRVTTDQTNLHFEVEDDGLGFDVSNVMDAYDERGSFGLLNMRERAQILEGTLEIQSPRPNGEDGTFVHGTVPRVRLDAGSEQELTPLALLNKQLSP